MDLKLSFWIIDDYFFGNLNIGNLSISFLFLVFYCLLSIGNFLSENNNNKWVSSNNLNIDKIRSLFFFNLLSSFIIPYLGVFTGIFIFHLNSIFFIEYFFEKYLIDKTEVVAKTEVVDMQRDNNAELSELLIED